MQKTGWTIHSPFLVLFGLKKNFTLDVITRGQATTIFLCIGPFSAGGQTNERTTNRVNLVQACSWPVWEGSLLQLLLLKSCKTKKIYFNKAATTVIFVSGIESTIFSCTLCSWQICTYDPSRQEGSRVGVKWKCKNRIVTKTSRAGAHVTVTQWRSVLVWQGVQRVTAWSVEPFKLIQTLINFPGIAH